MMNRIIICLALCLLFFSGSRSFAQLTQQYYDLSTGIVNGTSSTLINLTADDDTWTVCLPGSNYLNPASYIPAKCANPVWGYPPTYTTYSGASAAVRWISPFVDGNGNPTDNAPQGYYYYKMKFKVPILCNKESVGMSMTHIGGDNIIDQILVNNVPSTSPAPASYGYSPIGFGFQDITSLVNSNAVNEIIIRVNNYNLWSGMQIRGSVIITSNFLDPSFCTSSTLTGLTASATGTGTHTWEVYSSGSGNTGTYGYLGTYSGTNLTINSGGPCYIVKHTVTSECGTKCETQNICKKNCDQVICTLFPPEQFGYDGAQFTWSPVAGASSYSIEIIENDGACCGSLVWDPTPTTLTTTNTYYPYSSPIRSTTTCFSYRLKAFCPGGASITTAWKCYKSSGISGQSISQSGGVRGKQKLEPVETTVNLFPNPAKGIVSIDIETGVETNYTIGVFDISGKLIRLLEPGKVTSGKVTVKWDSGEVSKGVYFIKVTTADKQVITKKLVIE